MSVEKILFGKKMKIPKRLKKFAIESANRHAKWIGVSHYKITIMFVNDKEMDGEKTINGEAVIDRRYLRACIKLYPEALKKWKHEGDPALDHIIAHEVAHCATEHFKDVAMARYCDDGEMRDAWETCTEVIAQLSLRCG